MGQIMLNGNAYGGINGPSIGDRVTVIPTFESGAKLADIVVNNDTTSIYMPSGGTINDIQVNNVSVVDQYGVGKIDLSPYQLALTSGQYISVNNNTINTTFGIFQGATSSLEGTYGLVPTPSATDKELFLKNDGTWSELPPTGRTVIANPETIPTDSLNKILIDDITYSVAGTDEKVVQTETTTNANYELLFSESADNTTRTEGARKSKDLLYNPNNISLSIGASTGMTINGSNNDIILQGNGNTWDGTHTSLKDAIISAGGGGGGGGQAHGGTETPSVNLGNNGDYYYQYDQTGDIQIVYVKLNDDWHKLVGGDIIGGGDMSSLNPHYSFVGLKDICLEGEIINNE